MEDLRLDALPGVGPVTTKKLSDAGIHQHNGSNSTWTGRVSRNYWYGIKTPHPTL